MNTRIFVVQRHVVWFTGWLILSWLSGSCIAAQTLAITQDPTVPSQKLLQKLRPQPDSKVKPGQVRTEVAFPPLKIIAMVFRNPNHGTALVRIENDKPIRVYLRREPKGSKGQNIRLGALSFEVKGFTANAILFEETTSKRKLWAR